MHGMLLEDSLGCSSAAAKIFFLILEEIHRPYICLNKFYKPEICSVPVTHAALWSKAVQNSAVTWNTVFVWLLLHFSSAITHAHTGQKVIDDRFFFCLFVV